MPDTTQLIADKEKAMTSEEIDNLKVEKMKELNVERERLNLLYERKHEIEKESVELSEGIRKAKYLLAIKKTEIDILTSEYWKART